MRHMQAGVRRVGYAVRMLFLDDDIARVPLVPRKWEVFYVRNAVEFTEWLRTNGTPDVISFDHDLAVDQYHEGNDRPTDEPNGLYCARWTVAQCLVPNRVIVHSWNVVGAKRIADTLRANGCTDVFVKPFNPNQRHDWRE